MEKKSKSQLHTAAFIEAMECLPVKELPEGPEWTYEIKLDGFRLECVRSKGKTILYSRRKNVLNRKFHYIATALESLPDNTVLDGELVALTSDGRSDFKLLQSFRSAESSIVYFAFDLLVHKNRDLTELPLSERRALLHFILEPNKHVRLSEVGHTSAAAMLRFAKKNWLEGVVGKRSDSIYQPGRRTGLWVKHRINMSQEFVIGGYIPSNLGVGALIIGFYRGKDLTFSARVRGGFVPETRREVFEKIKLLKVAKCPFVNLPQTGPGRWGPGLTAEKMKECVWVRPEAVAQIEFLEWSGSDHLRHTKFIALRDDKNPREIVRES